MPTELSVAFVEAATNQRGIGVVTPFDFALDRELWRWVPDNVSLYLTRMPFFTTPVTVEMATAVSERAVVRRATRDVLTPEPDVVVYACASGSFVGGVLGERLLVRTMVDAGAPAACTTSGALVEALGMLGVRKLAIATPYVNTVTDRLVTYLAENGVRTVARDGLGLLGHIWRVPYATVVDIVRSVDSPYATVVDIVRSVDSPDADAMFISCTNLPTYDIIEPLEQALGKPVLTANQVTMWSALRAMNLRGVGAGQALLLADQPSAA
jgi:maleate isomerase